VPLLRVLATRQSPAALMNRPDLIVCDWNWNVREWLSKRASGSSGNPVLAEVPVMFLSSAQRPDVIRRSLVAGHGVYCLRKPFAPTVLVELIDQALGLPAALSAVDFRGRLQQFRHGKKRHTTAAGPAKPAKAASRD